MSILLPEDLQTRLPRMYCVRQKFDQGRLISIDQAIQGEFGKDFIKRRDVKGKRVAVAVGSRGISNLLGIVRATIDEIKSLGGEPFIVSAMGSHGKGTELGQRELLDSYGINEQNLAVPVVTTLDVVELGKTSKGFSVYFDQTAFEADLVVPINRIKLHSDFVGELQSGLCKMLVIGLGNHIGCSAIHEEDPCLFAGILEEAASIIIERANIWFGLAIIENAYNETGQIEAVPAEAMIWREKELVNIAKRNMPYLNIPVTDVLVVEEIGKDISGAGFDPNVLGRSSVLTEFVLPVPKIQKMVLLNLTTASCGNGIGVGLFDVITKHVFEQLDLEAMYANAIACKCLEDVKIPLMAASEEEAIRVALKGCRDIDRENPKIVKIKNTSQLEHIQASEGLLDYARGDNRLTICT